MSKPKNVTNDTLRGKPKKQANQALCWNNQENKEHDKQTIKNTASNKSQNLNQICKQ